MKMEFDFAHIDFTRAKAYYKRIFKINTIFHISTIIVFPISMLFYMMTDLGEIIERVTGAIMVVSGGVLTIFFVTPILPYILIPLLIIALQFIMVLISFVQSFFDIIAKGIHEFLIK